MHLVVNPDKSVDTPDVPGLCLLQNLCHQSLANSLPLGKLFNKGSKD